jgi:hypothetical protein
MAKHDHPIIVLIVAAVFIAACASAPTRTPSPATVLPTQTVTVAAPTIPPPTTASTAVPATPTVTVAVQTSPPPTVAPTAVPPPTPLPVTPTAALSTRPTAAPTPAPSVAARDMVKVRLRTPNQTLTATLNDSAAARDFASLLPLTLTLEDYSATEKISYLPKKLATQGAPAGSDPSIGDITYYAPWGNLAIFYRDFGYSAGLIILGKIDTGMEALAVPRTVPVTIERVE